MRKFLPLIIILFFCAKLLPAYTQAINTQDSLALLDFYSSTNGPAWKTNTNWGSGPVTTWYGVLTTGDRVTTVVLTNNNLTGILPASLGNLTALTKLNLQYNSIASSIPFSVGNLTSLTYLNLANNILNNNIPVELGNLANLKTLLLNNNKLTGSIPPQLGNLTKLLSLDLSSNILTGGIPPELGGLLNLTSFVLSRNRLGGTIPPELSGMKKVTKFYLKEDKLVGKIPASIGSMPINDLDLSNNALVDTFPVELAQNHVFKFIDVHSNQFTFEGFEKIRFVPNAVILLGNQKRLTINKNGDILSVSSGGTLQYLNFNWVRNGFKYSKIKGDSTLQLTTPGVYNVSVTDDSIYGNYGPLYSDTITVSTLPLSLLNFAGATNKNTVELKWQASLEVNTQLFEIQHADLRGIFATIGVVSAANTAGNNNYQFLDESPLVGINYYRLKMIDKDGNINFSQVISVKAGDETGDLQLYPNPARQVATLKFKSQFAGTYTIILTNISGQIIKRFDFAAVQGANTIKINVNAYAAGSYQVTLFSKTGNKKQAVQLIKHN